MIEENVVAEAGTVHYLSLDEIRGAISELGFLPRQRNVRYELLDEAHERRAIEANRSRYQQIRSAVNLRPRKVSQALVPLTVVVGDSTA
jgi:cyclic dehypoxanthinyl futalosine synthase